MRVFLVNPKYAKTSYISLRVMQRRDDDGGNI